MNEYDLLTPNVYTTTFLAKDIYTNNKYPSNPS